MALKECSFRQGGTGSSGTRRSCSPSTETTATWPLILSLNQQRTDGDPCLDGHFIFILMGLFWASNPQLLSDASLPIFDWASAKRHSVLEGKDWEDWVRWCC